jgi:hypothetical protein
VDRITGRWTRWCRELFDQGGVSISTDSEIAGRGVMFLIVDDVAAERRRLQGLGVVLEDDIRGDYSTLAQVRDPDGNLLTLARPPRGPIRRHDPAGRAKSASEGVANQLIAGIALRISDPFADLPQEEEGRGVMTQKSTFAFSLSMAS